MLYKNKRTGKTWDVTDEALLKRLKTDEDFEPVETTPTKEPPKNEQEPPTKEPPKK